MFLQPSADVRRAEGVVPLALAAAHRLSQEPLLEREGDIIGVRAAVQRPHLQDHDGSRPSHQRRGIVSRGEIGATNLISEVMIE